MRHFNFRQLFVAIVALLFSVAVSAQQFEVDGIYYDIIGNYTVCVTRGYTEEGATKYSGNIVIPKAVEYNGAGYLVTRINDQAFSGCDELKSITIPNSITSINSYTFSGCSRLVNVIIPNSVTSIGSGAFSGCSQLVNVIIPNSITNIGSEAFNGCSQLTNIVIPNSVTNIGSNAFKGCTGLTNLTVETGNTRYDSRNNCNAIIETSTNKLIIGCNSTTIPNYVTSIGNYALYYTNISDLVLPENITSIEEYALPSLLAQLTCNAKTPPTVSTNTLNNISVVLVPEGCKNIYKSTKPWSDKIIKDGTEKLISVKTTSGMLGENILKQVNVLNEVYNLAISGSIDNSDIALMRNLMPNLVSIDLSELDITSIPSSIFENKKSLQTIVLPKVTKTIGSNAFYGCKNLKLENLPEGLEKICNNAFEGCNSLQQLSFPNTLKSIESNAFTNCYNIEKIVFNEGLQSIGSNAFKRCYKLTEINLPNSITRITSGAFESCTKATKITFSNELQQIDNYAFTGCSSIKSISFPKTLKSIDYGAFLGCYSLEQIDFEEGLIGIGEKWEDYYNNYTGAFEECYSLKTINLPKGLKGIYQNTFKNCNSLTTINIPEGVEFIGKNAFLGCSNLKEITLPTTITQISSFPFAGCNKLNKVTCLAILPPVLTEGLLPELDTPLIRNLYAPKWTYTKYKLTNDWGLFDSILPIKDSSYPNNIRITKNTKLSLPEDTMPDTYKPNLSIVETHDNINYYPSNCYLNLIGKYLDNKGDTTFLLNKFTMEIAKTYYRGGEAQLLNETATKADSVILKLSLDKENYYYVYNSNGYYENAPQMWYFLTFPFDVKISDITTNCNWVVRKYDGAARAEYNYNETWVDVHRDSILHAGEGYIWACTGGSFTLPAIENKNKNLIFANESRQTSLKEYPSNIMSDNSWNLIGNPFPCYYDTRETDYTAPITVWDATNNTYAAYSPVDDNYILDPFEAFFVQKPSDVDKIEFAPSGRQLTKTASVKSNKRAMPQVYTTAKKRSVVNLILENGNTTDRTRLVINNSAKLDYEMNCDAAKFMSTDTSVPQLFTIGNNEKFAINERPMGDGIIQLGTHFGKAGNYTISMEKAIDLKVMLVDLKESIETDLSINSYSFTAESDDNNRFIIKLYDGGTTSITGFITKTKIHAENNTIIVNATNDSQIEVYNISGSKIAVTHGRNVMFDVSAGVYIVNINGKSHKVTVKK